MVCTFKLSQTSPSLNSDEDVEDWSCNDWYWNRNTVFQRAEAVLMGTHRRLGENSHLYALDIGVVDIILRNVIPVTVREPVDAGVLRL